MGNLKKLIPEPCPPFSLSTTLIILGNFSSYSLAIFIVLSLDPSLTIMISTSSPPFNNESTHLFKYFSELYGLFLRTNHIDCNN